MAALVAVTVNGRDGCMMVDNGSPEAVMFNRDAVELAPGKEAGRGHAASGQPVQAVLHDAPEMEIAGQAFALPAKVVSGDAQVLSAK